MSITTIQDVRTALVDPDFDMDTQFIDSLINRAETTLELQGYDLSQVKDEAIKIVVSNMVKRVIQNPDCIRQETETTGPSSRSITYAGSNPGGFYLTDEEKILLTGRKNRKAFTINPAPNMLKDFTRIGDWGFEGF